MDITVDTGHRHLHLSVITTLLLVTLTACSTTRATQPAAAKPPRAPLGSQLQPASATLPAELLGVWSQDAPNGRAQCDRYRALPADIGESDEGWISLIGSLVITPSLIHAFSEYGEGNFNVIKEVENKGGGLWTVKVQVGIDYIPADDEEFGIDTYQIQLQQGLLDWRLLGASEGSASTFFKCGDVRSDVYQINQERTAQEVQP